MAAAAAATVVAVGTNEAAGGHNTDCNTVRDGGSVLPLIGRPLSPVVVRRPTPITRGHMAGPSNASQHGSKCITILYVRSNYSTGAASATERGNSIDSIRNSHDELGNGFSVLARRWRCAATPTTPATVATAAAAAHPTTANARVRIIWCRPSIPPAPIDGQFCQFRWQLGCRSTVAILFYIFLYSRFFVRWLASGGLWRGGRFAHDCAPSARNGGV